MVDPGIQSHPANPQPVPPPAAFHWSSGIGASSLLLTKHHGLGNDFLIALAPEWEPSSGQARSWCHRRTGVGADGLIVACPVDGSDRHWVMTLWNADGTRAEISGNGIRCLAQAIVQHGPIAGTGVAPGGWHVAPGATGSDGTAAVQGPDPVPLTIETDAGTRRVEVRPAPGVTWQVRTSMGPARPGPEPSNRWAEASVAVTDQMGVDLGNPHLVGFVADGHEFARADMARLGPIIESDYPDGVNVHLVHVTNDRRTDARHLDLKVWERGVGVTEACGSGACAAAWAGNRLGVVEREIEVTMPGGSATVELGADEIFLTGPTGYIGSVILG